MSVLKFPRLYFRGLISWDPGLLNNTPGVYDASNARLLLPEGVTYDTFKDWVLNNNQGNWNYYGTHTCRFVPGSATITGARWSLARRC